jgi:hypothetical protein
VTNTEHTATRAIKGLRRGPSAWRPGRRTARSACARLRRNTWAPDVGRVGQPHCDRAVRLDSGCGQQARMLAS